MSVYGVVIVVVVPATSVPNKSLHFTISISNLPPCKNSFEFISELYRVNSNLLAFLNVTVMSPRFSSILSIAVPTLFPVESFNCTSYSTISFAIPG
ncbi:hypothetical protein D3C72_808090 [compost metagenome]